MRNKKVWALVFAIILYGLIASVASLNGAAIQSAAAIGCILGGAVGKLAAELRG